jgi:hypothetical protein
MPSQTLEALFDTLLDALQREFEIDHAMVLMYEGERQCLATVASRGYGASGVGAEIPVGQGVIGVAARAHTPIRIGHLTQDRAYNQTIREALVREGGQPLEDEIPWPGLPQPHSQLAVPICDGGELLGACSSRARRTCASAATTRMRCWRWLPMWEPCSVTCSPGRTRRSPPNRMWARRAPARRANCCGCAISRRTAASSWTTST